MKQNKLTFDSHFLKSAEQFSGRLKSTVYASLLAILLLFSAAACGQNDDQRDFEREAFSLPTGITETNDRGEIIDGNEDPDDWRIAPFFAGLFFFDGLPGPNPVAIGDRITFNISSPFIDGISFLEIIVLIQDGTTFQPRSVYGPASFDLSESISIDPVRFGRTGTAESARGMHRIVLLDGRENVISYGDVLVE